MMNGAEIEPTKTADHAIMGRGTTEVNLLSRDELARLERQLIPLLNTIRMMLGKRPVIVPKDNRAHD